MQKTSKNLQSENERQYNRREEKASLYKGDLVAIQKTQFGAGLETKTKVHGAALT
ncbi:hypothetical protein TNCV_1940911, partial [Trichonephila clavipes]